LIAAHPSCGATNAATGQYSARTEIIAELKRLATDPNPAVRVAACKELLDRGIGKAAQPIVGEGEGPVEVRHIISWQKDDSPTASPPPPKSNTKQTVAWQTSLKSMDGFWITATHSATPLMLFK
jgi:hypothetical protein